MSLRAAKRAAAKQAQEVQPPAKSRQRKAASAKATASKPDHVLEAVTQIVRDAASLPDSCREMLFAMVPASFCAASDERCEVQALAVAMVGELVDEKRAQMLERIDAKRTALEGVQAKMGGFEAAVSEAEAHLVAEAEAMAAKQAVFVEAESVLERTTRSLRAAQTAQESGDAKFSAVKKEKEMCEAVFETNYKPLREQELAASDTQAHLAVILPLVETIAAGESLQVTLPAACVASPSARGPFDQMVMQELENVLTERVAMLALALGAAAVESEQSAAAVKAAEEELQAMKSARQGAVDALVQGRARQQAAKAAVTSAKARLVKFEPECSVAALALDEHVRELEQFEAFNVACFEELRDRVRKIVAEPLPDGLHEAPVLVAQPATKTKVVATGEVLTELVPREVVEAGGA